MKRELFWQAAFGVAALACYLAGLWQYAFRDNFEGAVVLLLAGCWLLLAGINRAANTGSIIAAAYLESRKR